MDFNDIFCRGLSLIENQLNKENNIINNYDTSYKIINNNTIKIKLKNYYEKMFYIVKLEADFLCLYTIQNKFINCMKY